MQNNNLTSSDYKTFLIQIKKEIFESRNNALKIVNKELVNLYFNIGKNISDRIEDSGWGKNIVGRLSKDLKKRIPLNTRFFKR